jgi:glycolate oxidase FAD binding subunit
MARATSALVTPASIEEAAEVMRDASGSGASLRLRGGGSKWGWGVPGPVADVVLSSAGLDEVVEHNAADLTAIVEAGAPLAEVQATFARTGQMLALDPPLGSDGAATVGGAIATGDSGPLRHRYGAPRDLLLGMTVVLSDGSVARSGGKVIKNVAGYDLAKLFAGSFGTLGLIAEVVVRLRPLPPLAETAVGESGDPEALARAATALAHSTLEPEALDVFWRDGRGGVAVRVSGAAPRARAEAALGMLRAEGLEARREGDDGALWAGQRAAQRTSEGAVVKVSSQPSRLADVVRAARAAGADLVGRAGLGLVWVTLPERPPDELIGAIASLRARLAPSPCVVLDAPADVRAEAGVWPEAPPPELELMRRVKARFDPSGTCNRGTFVGGI